MVMRINNVDEIKGEISTKDSWVHFLNRSIPFFLKADVFLKSGEQRVIKIYVPFIDEISELTMIKLFELKTGCTNTGKVKLSEIMSSLR